MIAHGQEIQTTLKQRVSDYLTNSKRKRNTFVAAAEATEADVARVAEAEMSEYFLERALQQLRAAQDKVENLRKQVEEQRKLK